MTRDRFARVNRNSSLFLIEFSAFGRTSSFLGPLLSFVEVGSLAPSSGARGTLPLADRSRELASSCKSAWKWKSE